MARIAFSVAVVAFAGAWVTPALAQDNEGNATGSASASSENVNLTTSERSEDNYLELGIFGGAIFPSKDHNLEDSTSEQLGHHQPFKSAAPELGLRLGYYPVRYLGIEGEGAYMPTKTTNTGAVNASGDSANLWAARGHLVGQMPLGAVTPFVLIGFGRLGAKSDAMGTDSDPAFHFGAGVKVPVSNALNVRLDVRDTMTQKNNASDGTQTNHPEVLLGLSYAFGLSKKEAPPPPPKDTDGDGFIDPQDKCPTIPGVAPDGCPPPDTDKDGFIDSQDKCPTEPGIAPDGCPDRDPDKDGVLNPDDKCPNEPGIPPDGCPDKDRITTASPTRTTSARTSRRPRTATWTRTAAPTRSRPR